MLGQHIELGRVAEEGGLLHRHPIEETLQRVAIGIERRDVRVHIESAGLGLLRDASRQPTSSRRVETQPDSSSEQLCSLGERGVGDDGHRVTTAVARTMAPAI